MIPRVTGSRKKRKNVFNTTQYCFNTKAYRGGMTATKDTRTGTKTKGHRKWEAHPLTRTRYLNKHNWVVLVTGTKMLLINKFSKHSNYNFPRDDACEANPASLPYYEEKRIYLGYYLK